MIAAVVAAAVVVGLMPPSVAVATTSSVVRGAVVAATALPSEDWNATPGEGNGCASASISGFDEPPLPSRIDVMVTLNFEPTPMGCYPRLDWTAVCMTDSGMFKQFMADSTWVAEYDPSPTGHDDHPMASLTYYPCSGSQLIAWVMPGVKNELSPSGADSVGGLAWSDPAWLSTTQDAFPELAEQGGASPEAENCDTPCLGDPVNAASGALVEPATDVSVPGRGLPLTWTRTYVSSLASDGGGLGYGWQVPYQAKLTVSGSTATFTDDGGTQVVYTNKGGAWTARTRVLASLTQAVDGTFALTRFGSGKTWMFDSSGLLTALKDRAGVVTTLKYLGGRLASVTDSTGRAVTLTWTGSHISAVTDPAGQDTTYSYDGLGDLETVTDPGGRVTQYGYNAAHELTRITDPDGGVVDNTYIGGRVTQQGDPAGLTTTIGYSGDPSSETGSTTTMTDGHGVVTKYRFKRLLLQSKTTGYGTASEATTTYKYDPITLGVWMVIDAEGNVTEQEYDTRGNLTRAVDGSGRAVAFTYDGQDRVTSQTLPSNRSANWSYTDASGEPSAYPQGLTTKYGSTVIATTSLHYDDTAHHGDVTSVVDPDGRTTSYTYDAYGYPAATIVTDTHNVTLTAQTRYDVLGRAVCEVAAGKYLDGVRCPSTGTPPAGASSVIYDGSGRPTSSTDALGHTTTYTYSGRTTTVTDAAGHVARRVRDKDYREVSTTSGYGSATAGTTTTAYDVEPGTGDCPSTTGVAWCTTVTDPEGRVTVHGFDAATNEIRTVRPGGQTTATSYDLTGLPDVVTNPDGTTTTYGFDGAGRILSKDYSTNDPADVTYSYDLDGRRASMSQATSPTRTTDYGYGDLGLLASVTQKDGGTVTSNVSYERDNSGHVTAIHYPDGRVVTQHYDTASRIDTITDAATTGRTIGFGYDPDGNLTTTSLPGSVGSITSTFDATGAMTGTAAKDGSGTTLLGLTYGRTDTGQVAAETATGAATGGGTYGYDDNGRLSGAGSTSFGYDLSGNPTGLGTTTQTFTTAEGRLATSDTAGTGQSFGYNANGDRISAVGDVTSTYTYDQASQLTSSQTSLTPASAGEFKPLTPARILDTRYGIGAAQAKVAGHGTVHLQVTGAGGVPSSGVSAVVLNVTDVNAAATGWLRVYPTGDPQPSTSTMNWDAGEINANLVMVKVGTGGRVDLYNGSTTGTAGQVDLVADVAGYYLDAASPDGAGAYVPVTATRVSDSTVTASSPVTIGIAGANGVPADAAAAVVNLTAVADPSHAGYLTAYPSGTSRPGTSNLNVSAGDITANLAVVKIGTDGKIVVYNGSAASTRVIVDLVGYYTGGATTGPGGYVPLSPARVLDTRNGQSCANATPVASHATVDLQVTGAGAVPTSGVAAAVVNLTAVCGSTAGYLTAYPTDQTRPTASNLNWVAGETVAVLAVIPLSAVGKISLYNGSGGTVQFVADIEGYITSAAGITGTTGPTTTYTYDGDGLRLTKTTGGATTRYAYDVSGAVPRLLTDGVYDYIYGPDGTPLEQIKITGGDTAYYVHDQHGDTRALLSTTGTIAATYAYTPYGQPTQTQTNPTASTQLLYGSGYTDPETGFIYLTHRYYDPATAQFLTTDPLLNLTRSAYGYVDTDPLNALDPAGLCTSDFYWKALGTITNTMAIVSIFAPECLVCLAIATLGYAALAYHDAQSGDYLGAGLDLLAAASFGSSAWALKGARAAANAVPETLSFGSRAAAREGLPGDLAAAGNRFFRGATSKSQDFKATGLPDGGYRLEFFSPANNPGYGKLYVQEIDRTGQVLREYKNTMGPDGLIETKWVHGGP